MMDIHAVLKQLPHRFPFLLVDRVVSLERGREDAAVYLVANPLAQTG